MKVTTFFYLALLFLESIPVKWPLLSITVSVFSEVLQIFLSVYKFTLEISCNEILASLKSKNFNIFIIYDFRAEKVKYINYESNLQGFQCMFKFCWILELKMHDIFISKNV